MSALPEYVSVNSVYAWPLGALKRSSGPLGLVLQMVMKPHVSDENKTWVFRKSSQCS